MYIFFLIAIRNFKPKHNRNPTSAPANLVFSTQQLLAKLAEHNNIKMGDGMLLDIIKGTFRYGDNFISAAHHY